jgi:sulfur-carrier protein
MIHVRIPSQLHSYTGGKTELALDATTLADLTRILDQSFPGIRFRIIDEQNQIRRHIQIFVNGEQTRGLEIALRDGDEVQIIGALSGG